jgi:signal transduction histidine kinase
MLRIAAGYGDAPDEALVSTAMRFPAAMAESVMARLRDDDVTQLDRSLDGPVATLNDHYGVSAAMYLALRRGPALIGLQSASYRGGPQRFTPRQERIARGIAQIASLALEVSRLVDELERANRLKSEFVATMSHELRTPLNIILGYQGLLLDETFGGLTDEQRDALERSERNARSLLELISATLDLSRLESGRLPLDLREFDPTTLLRELELESHDLALFPGVRIEWAPMPRLPRLHSDPARLKVVLKNLLGNAAKYTHAGRISVDAGPRDDGVEFAVADTGIGIAPELVPAIFEAFRQVGEGVPLQGGVGLGLYIVRRLLGELGGDIQVESEPGRGSTFRVFVPGARALKHRWTPMATDGHRGTQTPLPTSPIADPRTPSSGHRELQEAVKPFVFLASIRGGRGGVVSIGGPLWPSVSIGVCAWLTNPPWSGRR